MYLKSLTITICTTIFAIGALYSGAPDNQTIYRITELQQISLENLNELQEISLIPDSPTGIGSVDFNDGGEILYIVTTSFNAPPVYHLIRQDIDGNEALTIIEQNNTIFDISSSDDTLAISTSNPSDNPIIQLINVETGVTSHILDGHTDAIESVAFSPDGTLLASGSRDNTIRLWNVETGVTSHILDGHTDAIESVAFSPDGTLLASGSDDGNIIIWNFQTDLEPLILVENAWVWDITFNNDGRLLASVSQDGQMRIWNSRTGEKLREFTVDIFGAREVQFNSNGNLLVSTGISAIRFWAVHK